MEAALPWRVLWVLWELRRRGRGWRSGCAAWAAAGALVIHGGLSSGGVLGDTWLLSRGRDEGSGTEQCEWIEVVTSGACVQRAHHSGGVVAESTLLIFSGQV